MCVRHVPCIPRTTDIMFFGDSSIDFFAHKDGLPWAIRPAWSEFAHQLETALTPDKPLHVHNKGCSGAPAYALCCVTPMLLWCQTPTTAIVYSMGGNDFIWLPCPMVCKHLQACGCGCVSSANRMFLRQVDCCVPSPIPVIFMPDYAVHHVCPSNGYLSYLEELRAMAGTVVTPIPNHSSDEIPIALKYQIEKRGRTPHPNLVFIDTLEFWSRMKHSNPDLYEKMFTGCAEQTDDAYAFWEQIILFTVKKEIEAAQEETSQTCMEMGVTPVPSEFQQESIGYVRPRTTIARPGEGRSCFNAN